MTRIDTLKMDTQSRQTLARLIQEQRIAAFGTLRDSAPFVSMVLFAASPDFASFYIHISRLAQHTRDILQDSRSSLMSAETDRGAVDPQTLARVSIQGEAIEVSRTDAGYDQAKSVYLQKLPQAASNFGLGDFSLFRIQPVKARYVAGFGKIFNLTLAEFKQAASEYRLAQFEAVFTQFAALIQSLPETLFLSTMNGWSPRDVVAHLIGWNRCMREVCLRLQQGQTPFYYADAANDFQNVNAELVARYASQDKDVMLAELSTSKEELIQYLVSLDASIWDTDYGVQHHRGGTATVARTVKSLGDDYQDHRQEIEAWTSSPTP